MLRRLVAIAGVLGMSCLLGATTAGQSAGGTYHVLSNRSTVGFNIVKWMVVRETGRFTALNGVIRYDRARPADSSVAIDVRSDSIDTGIARRDSVLRSDDFFDVARFPALRFRSVGVSAEDPTTLSVTGDLTIRDVTRRLTIPIRVIAITSVAGEGEVASFESRFTIDRTAFGVNGTRWSGGRLSLGHDVGIELRITARSEDAE